MAIGHTPGGTGYVIPNDPDHPDVTPQDTVLIGYTNDARFREQGAKADAALQAAEAVMGMAGIGASSPVDSQTAALVRSTTTLTHDAVRSVVQEVGVQARPLGLHAEDLGVKGNGIADDTDAFHAAAAEAVKQGVPLVLRAGMTVTINSYKQLPDHLILHTNGAVFRQQNPSVLRAPVLGFGEHGTVEGGLHVRTLGGEASQGVLLSESGNTRIDYVDVRADSPGAGSANIRDNGLRIMNSNDVRIDRVYVENYSWPVWVELSNGVELGWVEASSYAKAVHVDGCSNFRINGGHVYGTAPNSQYAPGYNGLLIEADESTSNIHIQDFMVEDAGEHGVRVSGPMVQREIYFQNCVTKNVGGSGFKVLGSLLADRRYNTGITFDNCKAIDSGQVNQNCCGFLIQMAQHVTLINPEVRRLNKDYSAVEGIRVSGVKHLTVSRATVMDTYKYAIRLDEACGDVSNVHIDGRVHTTSGQGVYLQNPGVVFRNINLDVFVENTTVGGSAFYAGRATAPQDSGAWGGINKLRLTISESTPAESAINRNSSDAALGAFFAEVTGRRGGDPAFRGGSTWMDTRLNTFQVRRANVWETV